MIFWGVSLLFIFLYCLLISFVSCHSLSGSSSFLSEVFLNCRGLSSCCSSRVVSEFLYRCTRFPFPLSFFCLGVWPGSDAFFFPTTFLPCRVLSGGSLSVASLRQFMTLLPVVMLSISIGCGSFWCPLTVLCLDPHLSFISSSLSELLLLCQVSLVFFPGSLGPSVCPYTWVFLPLVPPRFTLLVVG